MVKGKNKGEWSEFYAFLKLLVDGKIYGADSNLNKIETIVFPITKIFRVSSKESRSYAIEENGDVIVGDDNGVKMGRIDSGMLRSAAQLVFEKIKKGKGSFVIDGLDELMRLLHTNKLGADSKLKTDLFLEIYDRRVGTEQRAGFSVKSLVGAAATLFNASGATNFIYGISGLSKTQIDEINAIDSDSKIRDRLNLIYKNNASMAYCGLSSAAFMKNLRKMDPSLPEILAKIVLSFYLGEGTSLKEIIHTLPDDDLLVNDHGYDLSDYYFKIGNFLHAIALGMRPGSVWSGSMQAQGGCIYVKEDGNLVCYHAHNLDDFKAFLIDNTKLETPDTKKHKFGKIYTDGDEAFIKLNLQVRYLR